MKDTGYKRKLSLKERGGLFWQGLKMAGIGASAAATGRWEGWERNRLRQRSPRSLTSQDSELDLGRREDMISEARALAQMFPIAKAVLRKYAIHCVRDCRIQWNSGNPDWDRAAEANWERNKATLDITGTRHFVDLARAAVISQIRDGDILAQFVARSGPLGLRMIEADRVSSHGSGFNLDTEGMVGGVRFNAAGRPVAYRVWKRTQQGTFKDPLDVPAREVLHYFDSDRVDAYRGVTSFHAVLNTIRDLKESIDAERIAVKRNSKLALLLKGVVPGAADGNGLSLFANEDDSEGGGFKRMEVGDGIDAFINSDAEIKAHESNRPGESWINFAKFLTQLIATGMDLPFGVVWSMAGLGGPGVRFELQQANRVFSSAIDNLERRFIIPIAARTTLHDMDRGALPFNGNWTKFKPMRPSSISIDLGRESKAGIEENRAGLLTAGEWFAESGKDFYEETDKLAQEAAYRRRAAEASGIPITDIRMLTANGDPSEQGGDGEGDSEADMQARMLELQEAKTMADAYGVGVRAGAITPTLKDENHMRKKLGLPAITREARAAWQKDKGARRPITLAQPDGGRVAPGQPAQPGNEDSDDE